MMLSLRRTARLAGISTSLVALFTVLLSLAPSRSAQNDKPFVYLLRGGDKAADDAVLVALREGGFDVVTGVQSHQFDGTQASLAAYDAVVLLYNQNWQRSLDSAGLSSIRNYVAGGGGLITGERIIADGDLVDIAPASSCGTSNARQTQYQQFSIEPTINAGLPVSFTLELASYGGSSETCFDVKSTANVFYISSNGGGRPGGPGLVGWRSGSGRVASFSTLLSDRELINNNYRRLLQNTVRWAARPDDTAPPLIEEFAIAESGRLLDTRAVSIDLRVSDEGSGPSHYYLAELVFNGDRDAPAWQLVQHSGWKVYDEPTIAWTLDVTPGVHYMLAWVSDHAGNMSAAPSSDFVSYRPEEAVALGKNAIDLYRIQPDAGQDVVVRMDVASGDPDLYVWNSAEALLGAAEADLPTERVSFVTDGDIYQIEVDGFTAGSYTLTLDATQQAVSNEAQLNGRPRGRTINGIGDTPDGDDVDLPPLPAPQSLDELFLPLIWR
jgi:hypothetical protein